MKMNYKVSCFVVLLSLLAVYGEDSQESNQDAAQYLTRYGYLSLTRTGNHNAMTAIKRFQKFFHLEQTGELDSETRAEMQKPRCGNHDVDESGDRVRRYKTGSKWRKTSLTYRFLNTGKDLTGGVVRGIIEKAFGYWSAVTPLRFRETTGSSDFTIGFYSRSHGDNSPFDGRGKVLAHAFFPTNGRIHFDEDEKYSSGRGGIHLLWVAVHEIGHSIGLHHSNVRGTIMWPSYRGYNPNIRLHQDDINGIRSLYGSGGGGGAGGGGGGGGGSCQDKDRRCSGWGRHCKSNRYVINNCKKTCGLC